MTTSFKRKNNTASLFKNDKKTTDKHPFAKGDALIDGVEYWVAAWNNVTPSGVHYQSLSFERKDGIVRNNQSVTNTTAPNDSPFNLNSPNKSSYNPAQSSYTTQQSSFADDDIPF